jgi:hypothetical protein
MCFFEVAASAWPLRSWRAVLTAIPPACALQVDVEKPLGLQLEQAKSGLRVKSASGNASKAGISTGDTGARWPPRRRLHPPAPAASPASAQSLHGAPVPCARAVIYASSFFGDELWPTDDLVRTSSCGSAFRAAAAAASGAALLPACQRARGGRDAPPTALLVHASSQVSMPPW